jgi:hypothetical protein
VWVWAGGGRGGGAELKDQREIPDAYLRVSTFNEHVYHVHWVPPVVSLLHWVGTMEEEQPQTFHLPRLGGCVEGRASVLCENMCVERERERESARARRVPSIMYKESADK